ncbi:MAG TPA: hypothetical protein VF111_12670, partial [Thermoanaerobaculia bacterium]
MSLLRGANHRMQLLNGRFVPTMRANAADEALGRYADQTCRDTERLDADVLETRDSANRVVGVQSRQHQVAGHRR